MIPKRVKGPYISSKLKNYIAKRIKAKSDRNNATPKATALEKLHTLRWWSSPPPFAKTKYSSQYQKKKKIKVSVQPQTSSIQTILSHRISMRPHVHSDLRTGFFLSGFRLKRSTDLPHLHARCASRPSHPPNHPNKSSDSKHHEAPHIMFFVLTLLLVSHVQTFFSAMSLNCHS